MRLKSAASEARPDPFCVESSKASHSDVPSLDYWDNCSYIGCSDFPVFLLIDACSLGMIIQSPSFGSQDFLV